MTIPAENNPLGNATNAHSQAIIDLMTISAALRESSFSQARHSEIGAAYNRISTLIQGNALSGLIAAVQSSGRTHVTDASQVTGLPSGIK